MIDTDNLEQAKRQIKREKPPIVVKAQNGAFNRKILEYGRFDILTSVESKEQKTTLRQIDSGFNHVLATIAKKNQISLGIDLMEIRRLNLEDKADRLAKIMQNISLCKKEGVQLRALNYKDKRGAFSFLISLGASTKQAKEAISF